MALGLDREPIEQLRASLPFSARVIIIDRGKQFLMAMGQHLGDAMGMAMGQISIIHVKCCLPPPSPRFYVYFSFLSCYHSSVCAGCFRMAGNHFTHLLLMFGAGHTQAKTCIESMVAYPCHRDILDVSMKRGRRSSSHL